MIRAGLPRALGRQGLSGRRRRRADPAGRADRVRLRCLQRDDQRPGYRKALSARRGGRGAKSQLRDPVRPACRGRADPRRGATPTPSSASRPRTTSGRARRARTALPPSPDRHLGPLSLRPLVGQPALAQSNGRGAPDRHAQAPATISSVRVPISEIAPPAARTPTRMPSDAMESLMPNTRPGSSSATGALDQQPLVDQHHAVAEAGEREGGQRHPEDRRQARWRAGHRHHGQPPR